MQAQRNLFDDLSQLSRPTATPPLGDQPLLSAQDSSSSYRLPPFSTNTQAGNNTSGLAMYSPTPSQPINQASNKGDDLNALLNGLSTPQTTVPSFPTQTSPQLAPSLSNPSPLQGRYSSALSAVPTAQSTQPQSSAQTQVASPVIRNANGFLPSQPNAEVVTLLHTFSRRVEENFEKISMQLLDMQRRMSMLETSVRDISENQKLSINERREKTEELKHKMEQLKQMHSSVSSAANSVQQPQPQQQNALLSSLPTYAQSQYSQPSRPSLTSLQPATSLYSIPQVASSSSRGKVDQEELDRQLAMRLQEEMNRESDAGILPGVDTKAMYMKTTPGGPTENHTECPICGMDQQLSQIEAHVNKHLEENPNAATQEQKEGFLSWLFSSKKPAASSAQPSKTTDKSKPAVNMPPKVPQVMNLNQPAMMYPNQQSMYAMNQPRTMYNTGMGGMQIPPGMQLQTIPPGAPIPPGAVPLNQQGMHMYPSQLYQTQLPQYPQ